MKAIKIIGVLLILYSILGGMLIPLGPGLTDVQPEIVRAGESNELTITGYNTHFGSSTERSVWLKIDDEQGIKANGLTALDENTLKASFDLPANLPLERDTQLVTLVVDNAQDGLAVLPNALRLFNVRDTTQSMAGLTSFADFHLRHSLTFPYRNLLIESIRNTFYHIPMWFAMVIIFAIALVHSIRQLMAPSPRKDYLAASYTSVGILYGVLGITTGALWAKYTWGEYWSWDPKQNVAAIALLIYFAYFILRSSFDDPERGARLSAVYNIFAFAAMIPLLFVIPRLTSSLHPGNGGNPGFGGEDLDNTMRYFLYPAVIGWIFFGVWLATLRTRYLGLKDRFFSRS